MLPKIKNFIALYFNTIFGYIVLLILLFTLNNLFVTINNSDIHLIFGFIFIPIIISLIILLLYYLIKSTIYLIKKSKETKELENN
jgi:multisubunit Na+/H+ antiporter MnhE subunit